VCDGHNDAALIGPSGIVAVGLTSRSTELLDEAHFNLAAHG
jgi:hypothetical protein